MINDPFMKMFEHTQKWKIYAVSFPKSQKVSKSHLSLKNNIYQNPLLNTLVQERDILLEEIGKKWTINFVGYYFHLIEVSEVRLKLGKLWNLIQFCPRLCQLLIKKENLLMKYFNEI